MAHLTLTWTIGRRGTNSVPLLWFTFVRDPSASRPFLADSAEAGALVGFARWWLAGSDPIRICDRTLRASWARLDYLKRMCDTRHSSFERWRNPETGCP